MRRRCPECGQSVKEENLAAHMGRVHPKVPRRQYAEMKIPKARRARRTVAAWIPYAAVLLVVTVGAAAYFVSTGGPKAAFYANTTTYDFGHVPQSTVNHSFTFGNRGEADLRVWGISASCDCTSAHVIIGGKQSPHFGMHQNPSWEGTVPPGSPATLVVLYDATQMPDLYDGPRTVYMMTNDPANPEVQFVIQVHEG